jgi:hypothetical protein
MEISDSPRLDDRRCIPGTDDVIIYHGYPVITATHCEGWYFGAMNPFFSDQFESSGDAYIVGPDGDRADLLWQTGVGTTQEILGRNGDRWGVYSVWFPSEIRSIEDLVFGFRFILPDLQKIFGGLKNC